jgi:hypothetical protein
MHTGVALASLLISISLVAAQEAQLEDLAQAVKTVYDFRPHTLTDGDITVKSEELDKFWSTVKANPAHYLPQLREALADTTNPAFFFYDGSKLLLSLSADRQDQKLVLRALPRCDLRDVQSKDYLLTVLGLAGEGLDTSEAAFTILVDPKFQVVVPEHALTLGQDFALIYMLLPTSEEYYVKRAVGRLASESDGTAQESLIRLLWYTVTDAGDQAIAQTANSDRHTPGARDLAKQLLAATAAYQSEVKVTKKMDTVVAELVPKGADFGQIKQIRRKRLTRVSDEALYELDGFTALLRLKKKHDGP